jgi:tetratricopeptide (TPR) repeat protein
VYAPKAFAIHSRYYKLALMTEPEISQPVPDNENESSIGTEENLPADIDAELPPEPWTPERVSEWNAYYDFYVKMAAILLVFMVSCNFVSDTHVWLHLKTGQMIAQQGSPVTTDVFSYTENGRPWIDVPWLFQWTHAVIYNSVVGFVPVNPSDPTANRANADQIAVGTLVVLNALARLLTAWLLLKIRHRGPGTWWSALVVTLAFGVTFHPAYGIMMGGIAGPGSISPRTWGGLLFAFELYVLFKSFFHGRSWTLWLLIPTFLLWANIDQSFLIGLMVLAAASVGFWFDRNNLAELVDRPAKPDQEKHGSAEEIAARPSASRPTTAFVVLALSAAACLVNPFTYRVYESAIRPYVQLTEPGGKITTIELLSFFGPWVREHSGPEWYLLPAMYLVVVALGVGSFVLNWRRFSWSRFLSFLVMSVIWGIFMNASPFFAIVFAAVVGINGQEWYHDKFRTEGRLGRVWTVWSTGGRLVTLALIFFMIWIDITGWENTLNVVQFGLGYHPDDFAFESAEFLENHNEIKGNILNTSMPQGDVLIWKAGPKRKTYIDGRTQLFPPDLLEQWEKTRKALSTDDVEVWKPLLDQYQISAIMIETGASPATYRRLMQSPNWVPFYDDGRIVMFGRADASETELAFFKANRLDADLRAFRTNHPVPGAERPPNPSTMIDSIFQNRTFSRLQSRTESARRWLEPAGGEDPSQPPVKAPLPEPARCLLAIQDARTALARSPDDWLAFRRLNQAYSYLMIQEGAMLAGIPITHENQSRIQSVSPSLEHLMNRFQQRVTVLNYAIQTTPPPKNMESRRELFALNLDLYQLYLSANALDLARDRLQVVLDISQPEDIAPAMRVQLQQQTEELTKQMKQLENQLEDLELERQAGQLEQAQFALSKGGAGRAIALLADAERSNVSPAVVKPRLIDLYCNTGQPDKALELLSVGAIDDPNLGAEPGSGALRQGRVYFLLGNYLSAATLWRDRAIPRVRYERSNRVIAAGAVLTRGQAVQAVDTFLTLPGTLSQQASWEFDLAMCDLEAGMPDDAATHFTKALTLAPDIAVRPIAAYYLEKMAKPVPAASKNAVAKGPKAGSAGDKIGLTQGVLAAPAGEKAIVSPVPVTGSPLVPAQPAAAPDTAKTAVPKSATATGSGPK